MLRPKLFDTLKNYTLKQFAKDSMAGIIVAIVALPLAIAFAIASGVTPEKGLYTAVIAGFIISVLGGSRVQIGGPTGAFVVIVYGIIAQYGFNGLLIATMMAGVILVIMGFARFGAVIKFIPHSVIVGFTSGIAVIIFFGQVSDLLGLGLRSLPAEFLAKLVVMAAHISAFNMYAIVIGVTTIIITHFGSRITKVIPGSLVAIILASVAVAVFHLPVETIGSRFGAIPTGLPVPVFPHIDLGIILLLIKPAFTIALLAAIESLLSAVVADGMIGGKNSSNMELVAQGVANIVTPLFGGIPATGAIARTATNVKSGGRTPVSGIIHSIMLLLFMLFFGRLVTLIPMACLAGILMVVAYNMSEWRSARSIIRGSSSSALVYITTFLLTIFFDLSLAIEIGIFLAAVSFIRAMTEYTHIDEIDDDDLVQYSTLTEAQRESIPKDVRVYEIHGPLFFGAAYKFKEAMSELQEAPRALIVNMRNVPTIDSSGLHLLKEVHYLFAKRKTVLILSHVLPEVLRAIQRSGVVHSIGRENIVPKFSLAIKRARAICKE